MPAILMWRWPARFAPLNRFTYLVYDFSDAGLSKVPNWDYVGPLV